MSLCFSNTSLIVAYAENRVIGRGNRLPWHIPSDLKWFHKKTYENSVIMGYNTYKSIGGPLGNRLNIVVSSKKRKLPKEVIQVYNLQEAAYLAEENNKNKEIFFIGGELIYKQILPTVKNMYITEIYKKYKGDKFFPEVNLKSFKEIDRISNNESDIKFDFITYKRLTNDE